MKDGTNFKRLKVIAKLNKKMDLIKQEMYNTTRYRRKCRNVVDFEKRQKSPEYRHFVRPVESFRPTPTPKQKIRGLYEYLWDLRILPLYKLLKDSRKIVLYSEWIYFYQEIEIIPYGNEVLKECKKENILTDQPTENVEEMKVIMAQIFSPKIDKLIRLNNSVKQYFNKVNQILPEGFNLNLKNSPSTSIFIKRPQGEKTKPKFSTTIEKYKIFLNLFTACVSFKSIFSKFTKVVNSNNLHQSFINCFKRIPISRQECKGVKDLCLSYNSTVSPFMDTDNDNDDNDDDDNNNDDNINDNNEEIKNNLTTSLDCLISLIPQNFKIEVIDLYLQGIDPDTVNNSPKKVFYPFDPSKFEKESNEGRQSQDVIENNLYGHDV